MNTYECENVKWNSAVLSDFECVKTRQEITETMRNGKDDQNCD